MRKEWSAAERVVMTDYMVASGGVTPPRESDELVALCDTLFPDRSLLSVWGKSWDIRGAMGYRPGGLPASLDVEVVAMFKEHPDIMAALAKDIVALRRT
jgi:hypothetical protein